MAVIQFGGVISKIEFLNTSAEDLLSINVAENHGYFDHELKKYVKTATTFHTCEFWGDKASQFNNLLKKGNFVIVIGNQITRVYEDKDKNKHYNLIIKVKSISLNLNFVHQINYIQSKEELEKYQKSVSEDIPF